MSEVEPKHCGKLPVHVPHHWWGHKTLWSGPRPEYWCTGHRVMEGGFFGLRSRGTLTVKPPEEM